MEVEMGKAAAPETPASVMAEQLMEHITAIMMLCGGIESISATKYACGFGSRLHVTISPFNGAPKEVKAQGVIIKDALAQIMSVANITRIVTKPADTDLSEMQEAWKAAAKDAREVNGGSGQVFDGTDGSADSAEE